MSDNIRRLAAGAAIVGVIGICSAAPGHADSPNCDPSSPQFNSNVCNEDPQTGIACNPQAGVNDPQSCVSDQEQGGNPPVYLPTF